MSDPFERLDEGSPYSGAPQNPDSAGASRVAYPGFFPPGIPKKPIPKAAAEHMGTFGRAPLNVERPVELTPIDFDPRISAPIGVAPTRFDHDPRLDYGSTTDRSPAFVVASKLKTVGAEEWMFSWVQHRGQSGLYTDQSIFDQCRALAHYGDQTAARLASYIQQVNQAVENAWRSKQQSEARKLGMTGRRS